MNKFAISNNIKQLMLENDMDVIDLANEMLLTKIGTIYNWLDADSQPDSIRIVQIIKSIWCEHGKKSLLRNVVEGLDLIITVEIPDEDNQQS